jgi:hypothetical protein
MGAPASSYDTAGIAVKDPLTTQAPPLRQSRDTFGRVDAVIGILKNLNILLKI